MKSIANNGKKNPTENEQDVIRIRKAFNNWLTDNDLKLKDISLKFNREKGYSEENLFNSFPRFDKTIMREKKEHPKDAVSEKNPAKEKKEFPITLFKKVNEILGKYHQMLDPGMTGERQYGIDAGNRFVVVKTDGTNVIQYNEHDHFIYYLTANGQYVRNKLALDFSKAAALLYRSDTERNISVKGTIQLINNAAYLIRFENTPEILYWELSFNKSDSGKDFLIAPYFKISKHRNQPATGEAIIIKASSAAPEEQTVNSMAYYYINNRRRQITDSKYFLNAIIGNGKNFKKNHVIKSWLKIQPFTGTWEGFFINPRERRFENCVIRIDLNGQVKMWIKADTNNEYLGFCKRLNDLLIISYDYLEEIEDYRATIVLDIHGNDGAVFTERDDNTIFGTLGCIERGKTHPVCTTVALRKIHVEPLELEKSSIILKETFLNSKTDLAKFNKRLTELGLYRFFYGDDRIDISSLALVKSLSEK